jgi:hypothetical protein
MRMRPRALFALIPAIFLAAFFDIRSESQAKNSLAGSKVTVIGPSVSTSMMARKIVAELHVSQTSLKHADYALVVVRSSLSNPLSFSYETECELKQDAENQLNITGPTYHVYLYALDDDLRASEELHSHFRPTTIDDSLSVLL